MSRSKITMKRTGYRLLLVLASIALLSPFLANHRPLYMKYNGFHLFPAFSFRQVVMAGNETINYDIVDFKTFNAEIIVYPPVAWSPGKSDFLNSYVSPFGNQFIKDKNDATVGLPWHLRHWLGTNSLGADVLAGIIHGFRYSFFIAFIAILIASLVGITLGAMAGFYGNNKFLVSNASLYSFLIVFIYLLFYFFNNGKFQLQNAFESGGLHLLLFILLVFLLPASAYLLVKFLLEKLNVHYFIKERSLPVDQLVSRAIEVTLAMPRLILIITLAAIVRTSLLHIGIIIGISLWTEIARFTRAQALQIREQDFITAARTMGFSNLRILVKHILMNGMGPLIVVICFSFSNVILTESGLSFLGVGLPAQTVTWGSMLSSARENIDAWWLTLFPGCCILFTVLFFNKLADAYYKTA